MLFEPEFHIRVQIISPIFFILEQMETIQLSQQHFIRSNKITSSNPLRAYPL
jgi:hypothetical protein